MGHPRDMEQQRVNTVWLCSSALGCLLAFLPIPRFALASVLGLVFGWFAYMSLVSPRSRHLFAATAACNAVIGLALLPLSLMGQVGDGCRIGVVSTFECVSAMVCWRIYKLEASAGG